MAMVGTQWQSSWNIDSQSLEADFFLCKGAVESLLDTLGIENAEYVPVQHPLLHPTRSAEVRVGDVVLGIIGETSPDIVKEMDIRGRPVVFEFDLDMLMKLTPKSVEYKPLPKFPALYRHLAVVVNMDVPFVKVQSVIHEAAGEVVEDVELLDLYVGPHIKADEKSLTLSVTFRSSTRTLTDEEVAGVMESIRSNLTNTVGAWFRA
jgi:phenylalanyl-tRNA synthetase beta chain